MNRVETVLQILCAEIALHRETGSRTEMPFRGYLGMLYLPDLTVLIQPLKAKGITGTPTPEGLKLTWENGSPPPSSS